MSQEREQMVDAGKACPTPNCTAGPADIERNKALGLDLFRCCKCGACWFDSVTQPSIDSSYRRVPCAANATD